MRKIYHLSSCNACQRIIFAGNSKKVVAAAKSKLENAQ